MTEPAEIAEVQVWKSYPSWPHFIWLYFVSSIAALRGLLFLRFGVEGWEAWLIGASMLLVIAAVARRWAENVLTSTRVLVRNGYTGREIQALPLADIGEVIIKQGPVASFFDIGTIVLRSSKDGRSLSLKGVKHPEVLQQRIAALGPKMGHARATREGFL